MRTLAAALLVSGLLLGSMTGPRSAPPALVTADGEQVLQGDFHVHAFPGDGWLAPWDLLREARRQGLDVIAITNHNQLLAARLGRWARRANDPLLLVGQEVTAPGYHIIAAGIERLIDWRLPAVQAIERIHAQGGVAIAAHPEAYWPGYEDALGALDGTEVAHPLTITDPTGRQDLADFYARAARRPRPLSAVGSSDTHVLNALGLRRTYVFVRERTNAGVLEALLLGHTVVDDGHGHLYGDPTRRAVVETGAVPRPPSRTLLEAVAGACAWVGLLGLIVAGRA